MNSQPRHALVLTLHPWRTDGRVRRSIEALLVGGWRVTVMAPASGGVLNGSAPPADAATTSPMLSCIDLPAHDWTTAHKVATVSTFLAAQAAPGPAAAMLAALSMPGVAALKRATARMLAGATAQSRPSLVFANDWATLPVAAFAHDRFGCRVHYDTHELAVAEHLHSRVWRLAFPRIIARIERAGLARAATVSCVSPGIAKDMAARYAMARPPEVVRNIPALSVLPPRPVGAEVTVLYHGVFKPDRGLLDLVASVPSWPEHMRLVLRGAAPHAGFGTALEQAATAPALGGRVRIEPLVAQNDIVAEANAADIGIFLPDLASPQNRYALPNKLFEYLAAGLMTVTPAATDMSHLVAPLGTGIVLDDVSPAAIAAALGRLSRDDITRHKAAAHRAALTMDADHEGRRLVALLAT